MKEIDKAVKCHYTVEEVLAQLDQCAEDFTFPMLDNGYVYPVTSRMSVYRNEEKWALIIEVVGFSYRGGGHNGINNCLHVFGNCLDYEPGTHNDNFIYFTDDSDDGQAFDAEYLECLNPETKTILLRGKKIDLEHSTEYYAELGIELEEPPKIMIWEFLRGLLPKYKIELLATQEELKKRIPDDLPELLKLDEWHHIDLAVGEKPSQSETFQMIAKAIVSGHITNYKPTFEPNNHWKNWPEGGAL